MMFLRIFGVLSFACVILYIVTRGTLSKIAIAVCGVVLVVLVIAGEFVAARRSRLTRTLVRKQTVGCGLAVVYIVLRVTVVTDTSSLAFHLVLLLLDWAALYLFASYLLFRGVFLIADVLWIPQEHPGLASLKRTTSKPLRAHLFLAIYVGAPFIIQIGASVVVWILLTA